jgi:threonine/homoserine/homoserine lactone efflux protein
MLNKEVSKEHQFNSGQMAGVQAVLGIVILLIVIIVVALPVITTAISNAALTGTTKTIADVIPIFIILMGLVAVAAGIFMFWGR